MRTEAVAPARVTGLSLPVQVREVIAYRTLLIELVRKDLRVKYRRSNLGIIWSLLNPLLMMLVYTLVFSTIARFPIKHYPMLLLPGLLAWNFISGALTQSANVIVQNANLIKKVYFPAEVLVLGTVGSSLVNFLISLVLLVPFIIVFQPPIGPSLVLLPLLIVMELAFVVGLSLIVASLNVLFRDIEYLIGVLLLVWFFASPVIYPYSSPLLTPRVRSLVTINPVSWLMDSYQQIFYWGGWPKAAFIAGFAAVALLVLGLGAMLFKHLKVNFAEEI